MGVISLPSPQLPVLFFWNSESHSRSPVVSQLQNLDLSPPEGFEDVPDKPRITLKLNTT